MRRSSELNVKSLPIRPWGGPRQASPSALSGRVGVLVLATIAIGGGPVSDSRAEPAAQRSAIFEWKMPGKFGEERDERGLVVETQPLAVKTGPWRIDLQVTGRACQPDTMYRWTLAGNRKFRPRRVGPCSFQRWFPSEGIYRVGLEATVGRVRLTQTQSVRVSDWLIVSIGDSVASGEAVPDIPGFGHALWQSARCHR